MSMAVVRERVRDHRRTELSELLGPLAAGERTAALATEPGALTAAAADGGHLLDGTAVVTLLRG